MAVTQTPASKVAETLAPLPTPTTVDLELVLYARYYRGGALYEREQAYRFSADQAAVLLEEAEEGTGRPVWKRYKPKPIVQRLNSGVKNIVDAQSFDVKHLANPDNQFVGQRINVGDDSEIADFLPSGDDGVVV